MAPRAVTAYAEPATNFRERAIGVFQRRTCIG